MRSLLALVIVVLAAPASAAAADRVVATVERPTTVDAYDGRAVWSAWDPAVRRFRLTEFAGGRVRALPVAPRRTPFDVDLGPGPGGRPHAVFSRCLRAPATTWQLNGRRGCDVHLLDLERGRERRLQRVSSAADEHWPAIWGNRVAFTRTYPGGRRLVYWRRLDGRAPSRRLDAGARDRAAVAEQLDMRFRRVVFVRTFEYGAELRLATTTGTRRRLVRIPGSGAAVNQLAAQGPSIDASTGVWWMLAVGGDAPVYSEIRSEAGRFDQRAREPVEAESGLPRATEGFSQTEDREAWYVRADAPNRYEIHVATDLRYERAPPIELH